MRPIVTTLNSPEVLALLEKQRVGLIDYQTLVNAGYTSEAHLYMANIKIPYADLLKAERLHGRSAVYKIVEDANPMLLPIFKYFYPMGKDFTACGVDLSIAADDLEMDTDLMAQMADPSSFDSIKEVVLPGLPPNLSLYSGDIEGLEHVDMDDLTERQEAIQNMKNLFDAADQSKRGS